MFSGPQVLRFSGCQLLSFPDFYIPRLPPCQILRIQESKISHFRFLYYPILTFADSQIFIFICSHNPRIQDFQVREFSVSRFLKFPYSQILRFPVCKDPKIQESKNPSVQVSINSKFKL